MKVGARNSDGATHIGHPLPLPAHPLPVKTLESCLENEWMAQVGDPEGLQVHAALQAALALFLPLPTPRVLVLPEPALSSMTRTWGLWLLLYSSECLQSKRTQKF